MAHTPGPWKWAPNLQRLLGPRTGQTVFGHPCEVEVISVGYDAEGLRVDDADAALIAAAPEMLALLVELERITMDSDGYWFCRICNAWQKENSEEKIHEPDCRLAAVLKQAKGEA